MSQLEIRELSLLVHLGVSAAERASPQEVRVSVALQFKELPPACVTDELDDTVCYFKICHELSKLSSNQEFKTIEKLSESAVQAIRTVLKVGHGVLKIHKVKPPIAGLLGGVIFERDF